MSSGPDVPPKGRPTTDGAPPLSPASDPPPMFSNPPPVAGVPPPLPAKSDRKPSLRRLVAILLSLFIGLFLVDAVLCLADDSLILLLENYVLTEIRGIVAPLTLLLTVVIYALMGLTPMIPKRVFLPLALFHLLAGLVAIPFFIYSFERAQQVVWVISFCQVVLGLGILYMAQGRWKLCWPIVAESRSEVRLFSWRNPCTFVLANVFVLLPMVAVYLAFCASLAVGHFSDGFLALRAEGLRVQARKYVRDDGKTIQLVPMSHIGEPDFYRQLSQSFSTNSIILMEGVSDKRGLLTNKISYRRMAASLGVVEQQKEFKPTRRQVVPADVDVEQFTTNTIDFINLATLLHLRGLDGGTLLRLMQYSEPHFEEPLIEDVLHKRNRRVVDEIHAQLAQTENIIVPWGAAHMPGIAKEIEKAGFRVSERQEYVAIRFRSGSSKSTSRGRKEADGKSK